MRCSFTFNCFGKRIKELVKKILVVFIIQFIGWFVYTYIEEGFSLTDCIFNNDNIKRLKEEKAKDNKAETALYYSLSWVLQGDLNETKFEIYRDEFKKYFKVKEQTPKSLNIYEICTKWYLFTAITLTTVGYGNVVPKTPAGKLVFFPYCLIGIPTMLFFLKYIGEILAELCSKIVELVSCRRSPNGQYEIAHKELKSFMVIFALLWIFIILEAAATQYFPEPEDRLRFVDGVYFYFVSFTTIGYGDITKPMDQPAFEFRLYIGLSLMSGVVNSALDFYQKIEERRAQRGQRKAKCCLNHHHQSHEIEPVTEMVIVESHYFKKEFGVEQEPINTAYDNNGYANEDRRSHEKGICSKTD